MPPLKPIIDTPGFRNIATAIRQSTVTQQYHKTKNNDTTYDIRYGLADELRRKSRDNQEFLRILSEFLQQYSQENARALERHKDRGYRKRISVSTEDIAQLVDLVDRYGAPTVANLLLAFGYAYDPRSQDEAASTTSSSGTAEALTTADQAPNSTATDDQVEQPHQY